MTAPPNLGPEPAAGTNGFAIASLVLGIAAPCGGGLLSVIFGIIALVQVKRRRQKGKRLAIAGLAITGAWLAALLAVVAIGLANSNPAQRDSTGQIAEGGSVALADLTPGDCVNGLEEGSAVFSLPAVPCADPHEGEVYAVFDLTLDGDWPGEEEVVVEAQSGCVDRLAGYSPAAYDDPSVDMFYFHPSRATWRTGDREVICVAYFLDGRRTGSLAD